MKKHQNHRYFTAVCIASAIFAVLLCLALFLIVMGDRSELERVEAQAAVFLEQMEQAADSARQCFNAFAIPSSRTGVVR